MPKRTGDSPSRGGRHQRKKLEEEKTSKKELVKPLADVHGLSPVCYKLLEHWSWGNSSAWEVCELSRSVGDTFSTVPKDIQLLSSCGSAGHHPANSQRDLLRLPALQQLKAPEPYNVKCWIIQNPGTRPVLAEEEVSIFCPHDWAYSLSCNGLLSETMGDLDDMETFWKKVPAADPKFFSSHGDFLKDKAQFMPLAVHADKGPHSKHDSLHCITMYSLIAHKKHLGLEHSSFLLCAIPNSCLVTPKKCKELNLATVEATMDTIGKVLAWSFNSWFHGKHPKVDAFGCKLTDDRTQLVGKSICHNQMKAIIWCVPADCEHNSVEYGLPHFSSNQPCMRCKCNTSCTPWNDFGRDAKWRLQPYTKEEVAAHPLTTHWLLTIHGVNHFTFAYDFMHCADIGCSAACIANMFYDMVFKELVGTRANKVCQLLDLIHAAYHKLGISDGRISRLAYSHFCDNDAPHQHYPSLMSSAIKAKQTANLVPVCLELAQDFNDESDYAKWRFNCFKHLNRLYTIQNNGDLFLTVAESNAYADSAYKFAQYYTKLSHWSYTLDAGKIGHFQWGQLPKFHFLLHIAEDAQFLNPRVAWAYPGEHFVGNHTRLAAACLAALQPWQVPATVCKKYQIGKHLQFLHLC